MATTTQFSAPKGPGLLQQWWLHKGSLVISCVITLAALAIYYITFVGERPMPLFDFVDRLELSSLDLRFQYRGRMQPDRPAVQRDPVPRLEFGAERRHFAVHLQPSLAHPAFHFAARADAGRGQQLLHAFCRRLIFFRR